MKTKHYLQKKIIFSVFGEKYYHKIKAKKILFDYLVGKDYDNIYRHISKILPNDSVVLDIGANMGQCLSRFSKIFKKGKIVSVEPLPVNLDALYDMQRILNIENSLIIPKAINRSIGSITISIPKINGIPITTQASLLDNIIILEEDKEKIEVLTTTIDEITASLKLNKVDYLKIDTEGFDSVVLESGKDTIKENLPLIRIENNFFESDLDWLVQIGYLPFKFVNDKFAIMNTYLDSTKFKGDTYLATEQNLTTIQKIFSRC